MKKLLVALLLVCSGGAYAQYIQGGLVSQGTLMSTKTEVVRSGFDVWVGGGGDFAVNQNMDVSGHFDVNAGYNLNPRLFVGAGLNYTGLSAIPSIYVNVRPYFSRDLNSLYLNVFAGMVLGGNVFVDWADYYYDEIYNYCSYAYAGFCKPAGLMGGCSLGYVWNHFAVECGLNVIGCKMVELDYGGYYNEDYRNGTFICDAINDPTDYSWSEFVRRSSYAEELSALLDVFLRVSWRF